MFISLIKIMLDIFFDFVRLASNVEIRDYDKNSGIFLC